MAKRVQVAVDVGSIERQILIVRGQRVLLDANLAELYGVTTKALNQAVRRNIDRFPDDFMFQLTWDEAAISRSHSVTLVQGQPEVVADRTNRSTEAKPGSNFKYRPRAFTEQGVAMLSSVLRSKRAVLVNIEIMRTFVRLRRLLASNAELSRKLAAFEKKYDSEFRIVFTAIRELMTPLTPPKKRLIGFEPWE